MYTFDLLCIIFYKFQFVVDKYHGGPNGLVDLRLNDQPVTLFDVANVGTSPLGNANPEDVDANVSYIVNRNNCGSIINLN